MLTEFDIPEHRRGRHGRKCVIQLIGRVGFFKKIAVRWRRLQITEAVSSSENKNADNQNFVKETLLHQPVIQKLTAKGSHWSQEWTILKDASYKENVSITTGILRSLLTITNF